MVTGKKLLNIRWEYNRSNGNMSMPFNGIPYMLLVAQDYQCHQGKRMHKASTTKKTKKFSNHLIIMS